MIYIYKISQIFLLFSLIKSVCVLRSKRRHFKAEFKVLIFTAKLIYFSLTSCQKSFLSN